MLSSLSGLHPGSVRRLPKSRGHIPPSYMTTKAFRFLQRPYGTLGKRGRETVWARKGINTAYPPLPLSGQLTSLPRVLPPQDSKLPGCKVTRWMYLFAFPLSSSYTTFKCYQQQSQEPREALPCGYTSDSSQGELLHVLNDSYLFTSTLRGQAIQIDALSLQQGRQDFPLAGQVVHG